MSYPIKGTPFYDDVVNDIVNPAPWEQATDRDIKLRRPHSSWYYWFATTRVVSEVRAFKLGRAPGATRPLAAATQRAKAMLGRAGMRLDPALRLLEAGARRVADYRARS